MKSRVIRSRRGARLEQNGCVLSEVLARPGPTHSVFDLLAAAAVVAGSSGSRLAMLGFAGGGMMAPLCALDGHREVHAVDLSGEGYELYRSVTIDDGCCELHFSQEDAVEWLRRQRGSFDAIVEDLSVPAQGDVIKPAVSWEVLPALIRRKLRKPGVAVFNLLPTPGMPWERLVESCRIPGLPAVVVELEEYHNRVLIQGRRVEGARTVGRRLRRELAGIGSELATGLAVRGLSAG